MQIERFWQRALCVVLLATVAGCSRSEEVIVCKADDPKDCKSATELNAQMAAESAKQRRYAEALPFDYRDLVHALLVEYIHSTPLPGTEHQYFLSVFDSDVDSALAAKMQASSINVLPASAWDPNVDPPEHHGSGSRVRISIGEIKQVEPDTFSVRIGYYCGGLCAASQEYILKKDDSGWRIVDRKLDWIA